MPDEWWRMMQIILTLIFSMQFPFHPAMERNRINVTISPVYNTLWFHSQFAFIKYIHQNVTWLLLQLHVLSITSVSRRCAEFVVWSYQTFLFRWMKLGTIGTMFICASDKCFEYKTKNNKFKKKNSKMRASGRNWLGIHYVHDAWCLMLNSQTINKIKCTHIQKLAVRMIHVNFILKSSYLIPCFTFRIAVTILN